jgi:ABC-2 type transport system ATP-binding protein
VSRGDTLPPPDITLGAEGLSHRFGRRQVLRDVTFSLTPGVVGLLGPNGAGKSTLIRLLARSLVPTGGSVSRPTRRDGVDPVGYLPQEPALLRHLTGREFVEYVAWLRRVPAADAARASARALEAVGLADRADERIRRLSGGMRQRVGLAASVVNEPCLLLLDEPTNGLDVEQRLLFREMVRALAPGAITVISSHLTEDLVPVCDHVVVLREGTVAFDGTLQALCGADVDAPRPTAEQVNAAYLALVRR